MPNEINVPVAGPFLNFAWIGARGIRKSFDL